MHYETVDDPTSKQYKYMIEGETSTNGLRMHSGRYLVALGSMYGNIGSKFNITLSSGEVIKVIKGDTKKEECTHADGSMLEFIVDADVLPSIYKGQNGLDELFEGTIIKIKQVEDVE